MLGPAPARRLPFRAFAAAWLLAAAVGVARAETPIPDPPSRWLTDRAGFLPPTTAAALDERLRRYEATSGHQVLVYIDRTTGGVPIEDWAVRAFERWRVGRKGLDDGVVLFIFSEDRRLRIEVGYGLEDRLPDLRAARIINERIVPRIRAGDPGGAVAAGLEGITAALGSEGGPVDRADHPQVSKWHLVAVGLGFLLFLILAITHPRLAWLMLLSIGSGRGGGGWGGRGGGGFSGGGGRSGGGGASGSW